VTARSKAWVCLPFVCWECGFECRRGHGCLSLVSVVCCQEEVSVSGWSLVQRSPIDCCVFECDREASILKRPWPTGAVGPCKDKDSTKRKALPQDTYIHKRTLTTDINYIRAPDSTLRKYHWNSTHLTIYPKHEIKTNTDKQLQT
jgi:hypothetical protein